MPENRLNYTQYDFQELVNQLIARLQTEDAWLDTYRSSTGQMLIELFSYVGNLINYSIERQAEEGYINTAQLRSSVINLVRLVNYQPSRMVSAYGILMFELETALSKNVYIPAFTECQTSDGIKYVTTEDVVILAGQTTVNANSIQGFKIEKSVVSNGSLNQIDNINDTTVENSNLFVYVDNEMWTKVDTFLFSTPTSKHYKVRNELNETISIIFGDNVNSLAPANGSTKLFKYVSSSGKEGNVYTVNSIVTINDTIYDVDGVVISTISVTNDDILIGGDDAEDTESIRYNAPKVFATGDRAVTKPDYLAILNAYAGIADSNVWGENEESPPNYDLFNQVKLSVILQNWIIPGDTFKASLADYLYDKAQITVKYVFSDPVIIYLIPVIALKVISGYQLSQVQSDVEDVLGDMFLLGTTAKIGYSKRISDLVSTIDGVSGISYSHTEVDIYKELILGYDSFNNYGEILDLPKVKLGTVKLYIGDDLVGIDDGQGNIVLSDLTLGKSITASGSNSYITEPFLAIDKKQSNYWTSPVAGPLPVWLRIDLGLNNNKMVGSYSISPRTSDANSVPTAWKFQGSNDGSTWVDLDEQSGYVWSDDDPIFFEIENTNVYRYYRLYITATGGGSYVQIREVGLHEQTPVYTISGTIDYDTGEIGVDTSPLPGSEVVLSARYQQDNTNGDIIIEKNQICKLQSVDINYIDYI